MYKIISLIIALGAVLGLRAADPWSTDYTYSQCRGSLMPYPTEINPAVFPDTLVPVFINHVGRHGARYPASAANCLKLAKWLAKADSLNTLTPAGRRLQKLNETVMARSDGQWGALDSLGMAEQRAIATRMFYNFGEAFSKAKGGATISAISSYSPRCMMSMFSFVHQLDRMDNRINFTTSSGRVNSALMRPFDIDESYIEFRRSDATKEAYESVYDMICPTAPARKLFGERYPFKDDKEQREMSLTAYYVVAGCAAMSLEADASAYFTREEFNALWACFNLRQYLQRTATTISTIPADIASDLLLDLVTTTDNFISGASTDAACLRFGHAETLMPLLSLMRLSGCYYMTNYFDTVAQHWRDFYVVPMAANLQMILFKSTKSGKYYLRVDLNETPVPLQPNSSELYLPWATAREYLTHCLGY